MARVNNSKSAKKPAAKLAAPLAKNTPAIKTERVDTQELQGPGESVVTFEQGQKKVEESEIEVENNLDNFNTKAAMLKFMEEPMTISIAEVSDAKKQEVMVFCAVNGRGPGPGGTPYLPRGVDITIARKYVEVLVRARPERVGNKEIIKENGDKTMEYPKTSSQMYPFQVIRDDNPKGRQWLSDLMRQR